MRKLSDFFSITIAKYVRHRRQINTICLLCLLLFSGNVFAQRNCSQKLKDAEISYKNGRLNEVPSILRGCLSSGFNKDEQVQAYRLLALTYIYLDEQKKAEQAVLSLIRIAPDYKISTTRDPTEFIELFKSFRTVPIVIPTIKAGINNSWVRVRETYLTDNPSLASPTYKIGFGYQLEIDIEIPIIEHISAGTGLHLAGRNFTSSSTFNDFQTLTLKEKQAWIDIPFFAKYTHDLKTIHTFLVAGPVISLLYNAKGTVERKNNSGVPNAITTTVDLMKLRNGITFGGIIGGGASYKLGKGYALAEIRYHHLFSKVTKSVTLDMIPSLPYEYGYIDDNFSLANVSLSVGYTYPIYSPKKLK